MTDKKKHYHLRKPVKIAIPIITILIASLLILLLSNNSQSFTSEVSNESVFAGIKDSSEDLSNSPYIKNLSDDLDDLKRDNTIIYYANKFKLNVPRALEIAHQITNNYDDPYFLENHVIAPEWMRGKIGTFNSEEAGIIYFIRNMFSYPEWYGSSIEEMRLSEVPDTNRIEVNGKFIMDNGLTFEQYVGQMADAFGIDKALALGIIYQESGYMRSVLASTKNNVSGMRNYDGWASYPTLEAGVMAHIVNLRSIIRQYELDLANDPNAIYVLSGVYVNGNASSPAYTWVEKVQIFQRQINESDLFIVK